MNDQDIEPTANDKPTGYIGLRAWQQFIIVLAGVVLGASAFLGSWTLAREGASRLGIQDGDGALVSQMAGSCADADKAETCVGDTPERLALQSRAIEAYAHVKAISNQQSVGVLAIGAGMALISVGFSLFLVGAEGAFKIRASSSAGADDNVMLYGTAPGLLAFALATVIIGIGATRRHEITFQMEITPDSHSQNTSRTPRDAFQAMCDDFRANPSLYSGADQDRLLQACSKDVPVKHDEQTVEANGSDTDSCEAILDNPSGYTSGEVKNCREAAAEGIGQ